MGYSSTFILETYLKGTNIEYYVEIIRKGGKIDERYYGSP